MVRFVGVAMCMLSVVSGSIHCPTMDSAVATPTSFYSTDISLSKYHRAFFKSSSALPL